MTPMASSVKTRSLFDASIVRPAIADSFRKLTPRRQVRNPVMFVVYVGSILTTLLWLQAVGGHRQSAGGIHLRGVGVSVVHGALRQLRRGHGRGPGQGPGRLPAQGPP